MIHNPCHVKLIFAEELSQLCMYVTCSHMNKCSTIMPLLLSRTLMAGISFQLQQNVDAEY